MVTIIIILHNHCHIKWFRYDCFELSDLPQLRIPQLLNNNGGLLCMWIPNNETINKAVHRTLEHWGMVPLATWHWLKICRSEQPVFSFRPDHKLPFETLLIACRRQDLPTFTKKKRIPDHYCIIGIPNANHSRKPPIAPILKDFGLIGSGKTLELYARYLLPETTSIGYEPLKFQDEYYYAQ